MERVIVLFEVTIKDGRQEDYLAMAASLKESLQNADGFLGSERFSSLSVNSGAHKSIPLRFPCLFAISYRFGFHGCVHFV